MMGVFIKGMEMPKNCKECPFSDHQAWCLIPGEWRERYYCPDDEVSEHCPLVEISPHGRLIDADALKSKFRHGEGNSDVDSAWISTIRRFITQADTIIEAEGRET